MAFFSIVSRSLINKSCALSKNDALQKSSIRLLSSVVPSPPSSDNRTSSTSYDHPSRMMQSTMPSSYTPENESRVEEKVEESLSSTMMNRFKITAEVTVSKIFPAGFGWQSSSILASSYLGYGSDTLGFALTTGVGDGVGVFAGHSLYYLAKKNIITDGSSINMDRETQTGLLLGSAAFCSGTAWQPIVNTLQAADLSFVQVFAGTWVGCATAFYLGLRGARTLLSGRFAHIHKPTYENSMTDKSLSAAIGGATGFFVGTDTAYLPTQNFLIDVVGIHETTLAATGCVIAGSSTSLGFVSAQSTLNLIYPAGSLWNDGK